MKKTNPEILQKSRRDSASAQSGNAARGRAF